MQIRMKLMYVNNIKSQNLFWKSSWNTQIQFPYAVNGVFFLTKVFKPQQ